MSMINKPKDHDTKSNPDVKGFLLSVHRDLQNFVCTGQNLLGQAFYLIAHDKGYFGRFWGLKGHIWDGIRRLLHCTDDISLLLKLDDQADQGLGIFPRDIVLRTEGDLGDVCTLAPKLVHRLRRDATQIDLLHPRSISGTKYGPDIVCTANVGQDNDYFHNKIIGMPVWC